ncbi:MAG: CoB--CoM heterodisulfide reductase iron-sulfur subunit A family protein, partial [Candidatus Heimdallarchaeota archaeon]
NLAFIQCIGSRDAQIGHEYCSFACCMYSLKEAMFVKEQNPKIDVTIFYMDMRAFGKGYHEYYEQAKRMGINFIRCRVPSVQAINDDDNLELTLVKENGELAKEEFEMVVLGVGLEAPKNVNELSEIFKIDLNEYNFSAANEFTPVVSSRAGIYVCGGLTSPKDIPETVTEASAAAALASQNLSESKFDDISKIDNASQGSGLDVEEELRIGVLFCTCGNDIDSKVDFAELKEFAKSLPGVIFVDTIDFLCLKPQEIKNKLEVFEDKINRLIITACTPYKFETQFKIVAHQAGISPDNLELIDFRERLAWICTENKTKTTALAKSQLAIAHEKMFSSESKSSIESFVPVTKRALVVGGGLTGMTSAMTIADKGYPVDLVEKNDSLGGNLLDIFSTLTQEDAQGFLNNLIKDVESSQNINIHLNSKVQELTGYVGNFQATIASNNNKPESKEKEYGAIILATGAEQYQPKEYLYGEDPRVLTQLELERILAGKKLDNKDKMQTLGKISEFHTIVMIQCVGSRNSEHPYCSRVCCAKAIKNALKFKKKYPATKVYVVYQDIMTYGLMEKYYLEARREGIEFIRYEPEQPPEVIKDRKGNKLIVKLHDILLNQTLDLKPDLLVLSTGIVPNIDNLGMFNNLNLDYTRNGFLKEANVKFRPVDMLTDGIFIAGLVHSPRLINESITQAQAAGGRVLTIFNKPVLPIRWDISEVITRKCSGCEACISACPYSARVLDAEEKIAKVLEPLCQGCGTCAIVCPNSAAIMRGARKGQVYSMIDAAIYT